MKKALVLSEIIFFAAVIIFLAGCSAGTSDSQQNPNSNALKMKTEASSSSSGQSIPQSTASAAREISMTAKQFEFVPGTITVRKNEKIKLTITATDVPHGIAIPAFGINVELPVNVPRTVEFTADKAGTFEMLCSIYCGSGHKEMKGTLTVTE